MAINPAPMRRRVLTFASPEIDDLIFFELRDSTVPANEAPEAYGEPHPCKEEFPNHELVFISPAGENEPGWQRWYYAANRDNQDAYNYEIDGDSALTRTYVVKRSDYEDGTFEEPASGTADPTFAGFTYSKQRVRRIGQKELDSLFVIVQRSYVNEGEVSSVRESGTARGETSSKTTLGTESEAQALEAGIVVSRSSQLTEEQSYRNTEERLALRPGVNATSIDLAPGMKVTKTEELSSTEPEQDGEDKGFDKRLITTDADGNDAVFGAGRTRRESDPASGSELSRVLGGGVVDVEVDMVPDSTDAVGGFLVLDEKVDPIGGGDARYVKKTIESFPTLTEFVHDPDTDEMIEVTKDVIDLATVDPATVASSTIGDVTEVKPYDRWRSISIRSRYVDDGAVDGRVETIPIVDTYRYPPVLVNAEFIWNHAFAFTSNDQAYAEDLALTFDVEESYTTSVTGHIKRIWTKDPETAAIPYQTGHTTQMNSVTVAYAAWWAYGGLSGAKASAVVRTWQTPMAIVPNAITLSVPGVTPGEIQVNHQVSNIIPAAGQIPGGLTTVDIRATRGKLGYYILNVKQLNL